MNLKLKQEKEIIKLRKIGKSYVEIGKIMGLSKTRIWQIYTKPFSSPALCCKKHRRHYRKECSLCSIDDYYKQTLEHNGDIREEIEKLKNANREMENVRKKKILVTKLRDEFHFSFPRIAQLLNNHYSSIMYLYYSYKIELNL